MEESSSRRARGASAWAEGVGPGLFIAWLLAAPLLLGAEPAVLRVGMDTRSRPWAFVPGLDYSKEDWTQPPKISASQIELLQGVDIDVIKALGRRLNAVPRIVPYPWAHIEEGLRSKQFDVLINGWVPTARTPPGIVASSPYYEWGLLLVVRANNKTFLSLDDVKGARVGYFRDLSVERTAESLGAGLLVPVDDSDVLFEELAAGKLDAVIEDSTYVRWRVAHDRSFRVVGDRLNKLGYCMGLRKEETTLYRKVEAAIRELIQSGEIDKIRKRWEGATTRGPSD
jgi:polar amino acid transport system substrate-binding protein